MQALHSFRVCGLLFRVKKEAYALVNTNGKHLACVIPPPKIPQHSRNKPGMAQGHPKGGTWGQVAGSLPGSLDWGVEAEIQGWSIRLKPGAVKRKA